MVVMLAVHFGYRIETGLVREGIKVEGTVIAVAMGLPQ